MEGGGEGNDVIREIWLEATMASSAVGSGRPLLASPVVTSGHEDERNEEKGKR